jgi:hypothetical protein
MLLRETPRHLIFRHANSSDVRRRFQYRRTMVGFVVPARARDQRGETRDALRSDHHAPHSPAELEPVRVAARRPSLLESIQAVSANRRSRSTIGAVRRNLWRMVGERASGPSDLRTLAVLVPSWLHTWPTSKQCSRLALLRGDAASKELNGDETFRVLASDGAFSDCGRRGS